MIEVPSEEREAEERVGAVVSTVTDKADESLVAPFIVARAMTVLLPEVSVPEVQL